MGRETRGEREVTGYCHGCDTLVWDELYWYEDANGEAVDRCACGSEDVVTDGDQIMEAVCSAELDCRSKGNDLAFLRSIVRMLCRGSADPKCGTILPEHDTERRALVMALDSTEPGLADRYVSCLVDVQRPTPEPTTTVANDNSLEAS